MTERPTIFLVTVMKPIEWDTVLDKHLRRDRTWAWYSSFEAAEKAVLSNATDMFEANYYSYAVIEEVCEGLMAVAKVRGWYFAEYTGDDDNDPTSVTKIESPNWAKRCCNWGIG